MSVPFADPFWLSSSSHPFYKESHRKLQKVLREYVDAEISPYVHDWETEGLIPQKALTRHAQFGMLAASCYPLPLECMQGIRLPGGISAQEWDMFLWAITIDEMARCGYLGVVWGINQGATVGSTPLATFGTEAQKQKFLGPLLRGEQRHCISVTEPSAGSDVAGITTTATKSADGNYYTVNGSKKWVTQGLWAHYALCAVRTGGKGGKGISTIMIPLDSKGITRRVLHNSGVAASGSAFIEFDDVVVPARNLIGKENEGFKIIMSAFTHERIWVGITCLRLGRVALQDSYEYSLIRETFGRPLFDNQIIRAKFTKMAGLLETTHALMEIIVHKVQSGESESAGHLAALLKYKGAHDLEEITREAQQIFGGLGYSRSGKGQRVEQISRDVRVLVVSGGSEEILMDLIAKRSVFRQDFDRYI